MIKALLFDMDGVLADSEGISLEIGLAYFHSIGVNAVKESFASSLGCGERTFFDKTAAVLGVSEPPYSYDDASVFFKKEYIERIKDNQIALPGSCIVRKAREKGILTALCSSAPEWKVRANIEAIGLEDKDFDFIASGKDIKRNKPEKDIYALALIALGVDASDAVVFEDSEGGIISGKRAGCRTVSMLTTITREQAEKAGADAVIENLSSIPDFSDGEDLEAVLFPPDGKVRYGAVLIRPCKNDLPDSVLIEEARKAREHGYAPYSGFRVGAALLSAASGKVYSGCNVENSSYGATICAERNAITTAIASEGVIGIEKIAVYSDDDPPAPPCAVCLQVLAEFSKPDTEVLLVTPHSDPIRYRFSELLPIPFIFPTMR